jgi:16S rRNA (adenine1518-N6/adenine1519-N6)-dimethyltransferase
MTAELAKRAGWVIAIELDDRLAEILKTTLADFSNVVIINQDVLGADPKDILLNSRLSVPGMLWSYKVVANLPYYITSPILRHFLEASTKPETMVLMVQKEVAEAITAGPGQRSVLSISVQFYGSPSVIAKVPAASFFPEPDVDSAVVKIDVYDQPRVDVDDPARFFKLVKAGFKAARKQVANSLSRGLGIPKGEAIELLKMADIDPMRRAETFTLEEWARLWKVFTERAHA